MSDSDKKIVLRLPICNIIGAVFIALKLARVIDWSWWLVLLPIYGPFAAVLIIMLIIVILKILFS